MLAEPDTCGFEVNALLDPTTSEATRAVEQTFYEAQPDDLILLFFAGHGINDSRGQLYFALRDTKLRLLQSTALAASFVRTQMEITRARQVVVLLDCSFSGAFTRGTR